MRHTTLLLLALPIVACGGGGGAGGGGGSPASPSQRQVYSLTLQRVDTFSGADLGTVTISKEGTPAGVELTGAEVGSPGMSSAFFAVRGLAAGGRVGQLWGAAVGNGVALLRAVSPGDSGVVYLFDSSVLSDAELSFGFSHGLGALGNLFSPRYARVERMTESNKPDGDIVLQEGDESALSEGLADLDSACVIPGRERACSAAWVESGGDILGGLGYVENPASACHRSMGCHTSHLWALVKRLAYRENIVWVFADEVYETMSGSQDALNSLGHIDRQVSYNVAFGDDGHLTEIGRAGVLFGATMAGGE